MCGNHIIVRDCTSSLPTIHPLQSLPKEFLALIADDLNRCVTQTAEASSRNNVDSGSESISAENASHFMTQQTISDCCVEVSSNGQVRGASNIKSKDSVKFSVWQNVAGEISIIEYELTKLPMWNGLDDTTASIKLPANSDEFIKIILHKATKEWSDFSGLAEEHFPIVVRRDRDTIRKISAANLRIGEAVEYSSHTNSMSQNEIASRNVPYGATGTGNDNHKEQRSDAHKRARLI